MVFVLIIIGLVLFLLFRRLVQLTWLRGVGELPAGPWPFPLVGDGLKLNPTAPFRTFEKWAKQYGKLFTIMFGDQLVLVIADSELLKKAFKDDRFSGRPHDTYFTIWEGLGYPLGLASSEGEIWKEQRRFSLHALRDFGFGKVAGEEYIHKEARDLIGTLEDSGGQPVDNCIPFATAASNVTAYMLFGETFNSGDPRFISYIQAESENFVLNSNASILDILPWLRVIPPFSGTIAVASGRVKQQIMVLQDLIEEHKVSFDASTPRDYIDAYLLQQKTLPNEFSDARLLANIKELFAASVETTSTFLRWAMLLMIAYPGVQKKVQEEIDQIIGRTRTVTFADRSKLPYTEATIVEIFRFANFGPLLLPHKTTEYVEFGGYNIPKGTPVLGLAWWIMRDPSIWKNPAEFSPERFLDDGGELNTALIGTVLMFSTGKRVCPGEALARMETLIFFASILQRFTVKNADENPVSLEPVNGLTLTPNPYRMRAVFRR